MRDSFITFLKEAADMARVLTVDDIKHLFDALSISAWFGAVLGILPGLTTLAAFLWMCIRIYDSYLAVKLKKKELAKNESEP